MFQGKKTIFAIANTAGHVKNQPVKFVALSKIT